MLPPENLLVRKYVNIWRRVLNRVLALRPEWPLALAMMLGGALNIDTGLRYNLVPFDQIGPLSDVGRALSVLGSSTQVFLGACLILVGFGLMRRLATAWAFAVLLQAVAVSVNLAQGYRAPA